MTYNVTDSSEIFQYLFGRKTLNLIRVCFILTILISWKFLALSNSYPCFHMSSPSNVNFDGVFDVFYLRRSDSSWSKPNYYLRHWEGLDLSEVDKKVTLLITSRRVFTHRFSDTCSDGQLHALHFPKVVLLTYFDT